MTDEEVVASMEHMVTVGKLVKPFGVRGQARVLSLTDVPNRFENLKEVALESPSGHTLVTTVTDVHADGPVVSLAIRGLVDAGRGRGLSRGVVENSSDGSSSRTGRASLSI